MKDQGLAKRYAQGLADALKSDEEYLKVRDDLAGFSALMARHDELRRMVSSPLFNIRKKCRIINEILAGRGLEEKAVRFVALLTEHNRLLLLHDMLEMLPEFWNEKKGILTYEVSSVVALSDVQKKRLQGELEKIEKKPVSLSYRIDPDLIGGLSLRKGHIVYDISLRGSLLKLKEKIQEG
jgi:F-type H+-transporting ATPase subunit delta